MDKLDRMIDDMTRGARGAEQWPAEVDAELRAREPAKPGASAIIDHDGRRWYFRRLQFGWALVTSVEGGAAPDADDLTPEQAAQRDADRKKVERLLERARERAAAPAAPGLKMLGSRPFVIGDRVRYSWLLAHATSTALIYTDPSRYKYDVHVLWDAGGFSWVRGSDLVKLGALHRDRLP